jgi:L-histidine Nalpha-methyltransferase
VTSTTSPAVDVRLAAADIRASLLRDVADGLTARPLRLPPKWFYDDRGSALFDQITRLPEYYPTRREREILLAHADEVARVSGADTVIELGSGTSEKSRIVFDAFERRGGLERIVPFDVCESFLRRSVEEIARRHPGVEVRGVVGDFEHHVHDLPRGERTLVVFLGGTIGNLEPAPRRRFLADLAAALGPGDALLLGTDLVKDPARLVRAYDDAAGVTAAFNRNVLAVLNRELGAGFVAERFAHVACWDPDQEWIEMRLRSTVDQIVPVPALGLEVPFRRGEEVRTEVSAKFRPAGVAQELDRAGFALERWWTDRRGDFALSLARRRHPS